MGKKEIIRHYFQSWTKGDISVMEKIFTEDIEYTECYGPQYNSKESILKWFTDWHKRGEVISWDIKNIYESENIIIAEWNFKCLWDREISNFDGVTIAEFDDNGLIFNLREFQSKSEHYNPY